MGFSRSPAPPHCALALEGWLLGAVAGSPRASALRSKVRSQEQSRGLYRELRKWTWDLYNGSQTQSCSFLVHTLGRLLFVFLKTLRVSDSTELELQAVASLRMGAGS